MAVNLSPFEPLVLHKYINVDGAYGAQCWDLVGFYTDWLKLPRINTHGGQWSGWAYAMWDQYDRNGASKHWVKIPANQKMEQGDIVIWKVTPGIYPASHVAVGIEDAGANVWTFSQNSAPAWAGNPYPGQSTAPTIKQLLPKTGLAGYLRLRGKAATKSVSQLADEVLAGKHGTGEARKNSLGNMYSAVQAEINKRAVKPASPKSITELAAEVLAGKHGNGDARKRSLGGNFNAVQSEVNTIIRLTNETLANKYGTGEARKRALGHRYNAVQAEINRRYAK